jgi:hypothetical protein
VLGQLGNRIQHALRAFTPRDQKAVRAAAQTFRANPKFDTEEVITRMGVGTALVSTLDPEGIPGIVEETLIRPPGSRMGPLTPEERRSAIAAGPLVGRYDEAVDRESAYEVLKQRAVAELARHEAAQAPAEPAREAPAPRASSRSSRQTPMEAMISSTVRSIGSQIGRQIVRGLLGSLLKR